MKRVVSVEPTHDEIARLAYHLFEEGGGQHGHDVEHWLQAQAHLCTDSKHAGSPPEEFGKSNEPAKYVPGGSSKVAAFTQFTQRKSATSRAEQVDQRSLIRKETHHER